MRSLASKAAALAALTALAAACALTGLAQDPAVPAAEFPTGDLPDDQLAAALVSGHALALPSPPELLFVLSKQGSPKWRKLYYPAIKGQESDRTKTALRFGLSITEGHLATMARDAQKIRDVTNDLQRYARVLGIGDGLAETARSINALTEEKAWASIAFELEGLATQASAILEAQRDADLAQLITTGLWARLLQVSSSVITQKDFADTSIAIGSHWSLHQIVAPFAQSEDPTVISIREQISKLGRLWSPEKLAHGHQFDDALITETQNRLSKVVDAFTK